MTSVSGICTIEENRDTVFDILSAPSSISELSPTIDEAQEIDKENGGSVILAEYTVGSGIANGSARLVPKEFNPPERIHYVIEDDINGYLDWKLHQNDDNETVLVYEAEYEPTINVPDIFMRTIGSSLGEREINTILENLQNKV